MIRFFSNLFICVKQIICDLWLKINGFKIYLTEKHKVAFHGEGGERRWVRQAVMGVLRWRDMPGSRSSNIQVIYFFEIYIYTSFLTSFV